MAAFADVSISLTTRDGQGLRLSFVPDGYRFTVGSGNAGKFEQVSLTGSAFTALTVPTGAKGILIDLKNAVSLTLKGVTGDGTGIALEPSTNATGLPLLMPLGTSPSIGILNGSASAQLIDVYWV